MLHCIWIDKLCHTNRVVVEGKVIAVYGSVNKLRGRKKRSKSVDRAKCNFLFDDSPFSFAAKTSLLVVNDTQAEKKNLTSTWYIVSIWHQFWSRHMFSSSSLFSYEYKLFERELFSTERLNSKEIPFIERQMLLTFVRKSCLCVCEWVCAFRTFAHTPKLKCMTMSRTFFFFFRFFFVRLLCVNWWR